MWTKKVDKYVSSELNLCTLGDDTHEFRVMAVRSFCLACRQIVGPMKE